MRTLEFYILPEDDGRRVDDFLFRGKGISHRVITSLKKLPDGMLLNGVHVRTVDRLHTGDLLTVNLPEQDKRIPLCDIEVPVLYESEDVLVYNKPADMPVHQSGGHIFNTLDGVYAARCVRLTGKPAPMRAVNRLDKDTTGAVVVACNQIAAGILWKAVNKRYVAITEGELPEQEGVIDLPIERERPMELKRIVTPNGQRAVTRYRVLSSSNGYSLVEFVLETGRTHQIRVHMAALGCPLAGDELYGRPSGFIARQALHCRRVSFSAPVTGEQVVVDAPLPEDFCRLLTQFGLDDSVYMC